MSDQVPDLGPLPDLAWLPVDRLSVDKRYQRDTGSKRSKGLIRRIAEGFRWPRFGAVLAVVDGDGWRIVDGQHRVEAVKLMGGIDRVPAVVISAASIEEAALDFVAINRDRVTVTPLHMHHAMLAAGDDFARQVDRVAGEAGVEILRYPVQSSNIKPGQTMAVGAISTAIRGCGAAATVEALKVLRLAAGSEPGRLRATFIRALAVLFAAKTQPAWGGVVKALTDHPPDRLAALADQVAAEKRLSKTYALADVIRRTAAGEEIRPERPRLVAAPAPAEADESAGGEPEPTALRDAIRYLEAEGFVVARSEVAGLYRIGETERQSAAQVLAFAARMRVAMKRPGT